MPPSPVSQAQTGCCDDTLSIEETLLMGSLAHLPQAIGGITPSGLSRALVAHEPALDAVHRILRASAHERAHALLDEALAAARVVAVGAGSSVGAEIYAATTLSA